MKKQEGIRLPPLLDVGLIFSVPVLGFTLHAYLVHESTQALTIGAAVLAGTYAVLTFWIKKLIPSFQSLQKVFSFSRLLFCLNFSTRKRGALDCYWLGCTRNGFNRLGSN